MKKYTQTDQLQKYIDWENILPMSRYAGGHDEQMKGLFKNIEVIAHWNENDYRAWWQLVLNFKKESLKTSM